MCRNSDIAIPTLFHYFLQHQLFKPFFCDKGFDWISTGDLRCYNVLNHRACHTYGISKELWLFSPLYQWTCGHYHESVVGGNIIDSKMKILRREKKSVALHIGSDWIDLNW